MASLNFPDTSGSPPTDGSFTHTENGLVYSWDGEKWTLVNESDGAGSDYVLPTATAIRLGGIKVGENLSVEPDGTLNAAGDATIPNLQAVTDSGNTTTNGATFAGKVLVQKEDSAFEAQRANGVRYFEVKHNNYELNLGTADQISLRGDDGSADFDGTITIGDGASVSDTGIRLFPEGYFYLAREDASTPFQRGYRTDTGAETYNILASGRASFASHVSVAGNPSGGGETGCILFDFGTIEVSADDSGTPVWKGNETGVGTTSYIYADGKAFFDEDVQSGGNPYTNSPAAGARLDHNGAIVLARSSGDVFTGKDLDAPGNKITSTISASGTATFAGDVTIGDYPNDGSAKVFADEGQYCARKDDGSGGILLYKDGSNNDNKTVQILTNGSASFVSRVNIGASDHSDRAVSAYNNARTVGAVSAANYDPSGILFQGYSASVDDSNASIEIKSDGSIRAGGDPTDPHFILNGADGSASFAGDVTVSTDGTLGSGGVFVKNYGEVQAIRPTGSTSAVFLGANGGTQTSWIYADGSASFSGTGQFLGDSIATLRVGDRTGDEEHGIRLQKSNSSVPYYGDIYISDDGIKFGTGVSTDQIRAEDELITFKDGSASFAGRVTADTRPGDDHSISAINDSLGLASIVGVQYNTNGSVFQARNGAVDDNVTTAQINADGSATFAGQIDIDGTGGFDGYGWAIANNGSLGNKTPDGSKFYVLNTGELGIDGGNVTLMPDGSASFSSTVSIASTADTALRIGEATVGYKGGWDNSGNLYLGSNLFDSAESKTVEINADGSANFAGDIAFGGAWGFPASIPVGRLGGGNGLTFIGGDAATDGVALYDNSFDIANKTVSLMTDGSATFAGNVTLGADSSDPNIYLLPASGQGLIQAGPNSENRVVVQSGVTDGVKVYEKDTVDPTILLSHNGNATFAGNVTSNFAFLSKGEHGAGYLFQGQNASGEVFRILNDGSAMFKDVVSVGIPGLLTHALKAEGGSSTIGSIWSRNNNASGTGPVFQGAQSDGTVTSNINADGSASFDGNIQAAGLTDGTTTKTMTEVLAGGGGQSSASAWGRVAADGTLQRGFNIASVTKNSNGNYSVVFGEALGGADYAVIISVVETGLADNEANFRVNAATTSTTGFTYQTAGSTAGGQDRPVSFTVFY